MVDRIWCWVSEYVFRTREMVECCSTKTRGDGFELGGGREGGGQLVPCSVMLPSVVVVVVVVPSYTCMLILSGSTC